jgi:sterol desaturase/sphingolipid hydroxylase (fatty acid hydroxylase superfamily)
VDASISAATALRLAAGLAGLALAVGLERWRPFRSRSPTALVNDLRNLALWGTAAALLQVLPLATALGASELARQVGVGLFHRLAAPAPFEILATIVVLDAATYALHRLYHAFPPLWRLHRVHHTETLLTATTSVRFHPGEVLVSSLGRVVVVVALGAPVTGIVAFEVILLAASQLEHANVRLPDALDARLRLLFITPNLHRSHHSTQRVQADTNFGTVLTVWDRLLRTYRPEGRPEDVVIGLPDSGVRAPVSLMELLSMPFIHQTQCQTSGIGGRCVRLRRSSRRAKSARSEGLVFEAGRKHGLDPLGTIGTQSAIARNSNPARRWPVNRNRKSS